MITIKINLTPTQWMAIIGATIIALAIAISLIIHSSKTIEGVKEIGNEISKKSIEIK